MTNHANEKPSALFMSNDKTAGSLILSQLSMFNESVVYFENTLEPAILKGIDDCVEHFAETEENNWVGEFELSGDDSDCWLAPAQWNVSEDPDEDPDCKARFYIHFFEKDENDYWTALFCNQGTNGGKVGFMFDVDHKKFGGKNSWNAYTKTMTMESTLIANLAELGFENQGKGNFFLPVILSAGTLANSWSEYGEFTHDDESFDPLRDALKKLKKSVEIFDAILNGFKPKLGKP